MPKLTVLTLLLTLLSTATVNAEKQIDYAQIMQAYVDVYDFSGTVLIYSKSQNQFMESYGLANKSFQIPNSSQTRFSINSISKLFTTILALKLREEGILDFSKTVHDYLPDENITWGKQVTIHHLLSHRSGLPRESGIQSTDSLSFEQQIQQFKNQQLLFKPGEKYEYSNFGIAVLGAIIEKASNAHFNDLIQEKIIEPLSLRNTGMYLGKNFVLNQATPYRISTQGIIEEQRSKHFGDNAGGGMYSTTTDLRTLILAIFKQKIISQQSTELMLKNHSSQSEEASAYGFSIQQFGTDTIYLAAGSGYGTKSVIMYSPNNDLYIGITSNWGNTPIFNILRDLYLNAFEEKITLPEKSNLASADTYQKYFGSYQFNPEEVKKHIQAKNSVFVLHEINGKLFLDDELLVEKNAGQLGFTYTDELTIRFLENRKMQILINGNSLSGKKKN